MIYADAIDFKEGMAGVSVADLQGTWGVWGFINLQGKEVIPPKYKRAKSFDNGVVEVQTDDKWIKINKKGEVVE